jgi:hypothetical protein|tara:strand:- start:68 stop:694 length:627 start_codon:yes stop_codon:yes gene_type:complete
MKQILKINKHSFFNGDITKGAIDKLMENKKFDILYCDPPWGSGALKMFNTLNSKMNNLPKEEVSWEFFLESFCKIINNYSNEDSLVILEMGTKFTNDLKLFIEMNTNFKLRQIFYPYYRNNNKIYAQNITYFSCKNDFLFDSTKIDNTIGKLATENIFAQCPKKDIVLDPCCGFGLTLKMAVKYDMAFFGNEINQKRLDKCLKYARTL